MKYKGDKLKIGIFSKNGSGLIKELKAKSHILPVHIGEYSQSNYSIFDVFFVDIGMDDWSSFNKDNANTPTVLLVKDTNDVYAGLQNGFIDVLLIPCQPEDLERVIFKSIEKITTNYLLAIETFEEEYPCITGFFLRFNGAKQNIVSIDVRRIKYCMAEGNLTYIFLTNGIQKIGNYPISQFEILINAMGFVKIHRKYMVNPHFIQNVIEPSDNISTRRLKLKNTKQFLPISRRKWKDFSAVMKGINRS